MIILPRFRRFRLFCMGASYNGTQDGAVLFILRTGAEKEAENRFDNPAFCLIRSHIAVWEQAAVCFEDPLAPLA
jgi:hypothetical protein